MTTHRRTTARRAAAAAGLALLGGLLPAVTLAAPAHAAVDCVSEASALPLLDPGCDDVTPPETTLGGVAPAPNQARWVRTGTVTLTFSGAATPGDALADGTRDTGTVDLQCRLQGPSKAHDWQACTSPRTYTDLAESAAGAYTFSVRAVDREDQAIAWSNGLIPGLPGYESEAVQDVDATPASTTWGVDTKAPVAVLSGQPVDEITPGDPVLPGLTWVAGLRSNEAGATFACRIDGEAVPCRAGENRFTLARGPHTFSALAVDPAGNVSATPAETSFTVAAVDLTRRAVQRGRWVARRSASAVGGSVLETTQRGALLAVPVRGVREIRLLAQTARGAGKVRVRLDRRAWNVYSLDSRGAAAAPIQLAVRPLSNAPISALLQIEVVSRGGPVRLDGLVLR